MNAFRKTAIVAALVVSGLGALQDAQAQTVASLSNGPLTYTNRVAANRAEYYLVRAIGGVPVHIELRGDGLGSSPDLDLIVEDNNDYVITRQVGPTDREHFTFTPLRTGVFKITVDNVDSLYNDYRLVVRQMGPNTTTPNISMR